VLASNGVDVYDLDKVVHDRKVVPDSRAACAVLTGYYAQKRVQRLF
jgi:RNase H-fold protein (predicted Holliday junction resolvase)